MTPVSRLRTAAVTTLVATALVAAPLVGGALGTAARAQEPLDGPSADPSTASSAPATPEATQPEAIAPEVSEPGELPDIPAEDGEGPNEAPSGPAEPEPGAVSPAESEPSDTSGDDADVAEPAPAETSQPLSDVLPAPADEPEPASASALPLAAPVALLEKAEEADEEAPAVPTFEGADGCTYSYIDEAGVAFITDIEGCDDPVVPHTLDGLPVVQVGTGTAMTDAARFQTIRFPFTLQSVGPQAFQNATALTEVDLPDLVWIVAARAFENATSLASIDLGQVRTIEGLAFSGAGQVTDLVLPASLTDVEDTAFGNMPSLRTVLVEGRADALKKHTFVNTPALEKAVFHDLSTTSFIVGNMFQASGVQEVFFHDGAMALDCDATEDVIGGATVTPRCLYAVDFQDALPFFTVDLPHVEEGTVITEGPQITPGFGEVHVGFSPSLPHTVTSDVTFLSVFEPAEPGQYIPSQEDLVDELQGGFVVPEGVRPGDEITLVIESPDEAPVPGDEEGPGPTVKALNEPSPGGTEEPNPGGTLEPTEPEEQPDINDVIDVWMFSEPVELAITGFELTDGSIESVTVQIPADVEPGAHRIAFFSVFGDLFGWQPVTVVPAEGPADEGPADDAGDGAGEDPTGGAADGSDGNADDASDAGAADAAAGADSADRSSGGAVSGAGVDSLASTGASVAIPIASAMALVAVGAMLIVGRRLRS